MYNYSELIKRVETKGDEIFWQGGADENQIAVLESKLGVKLPNSFKEFLKQYGGGVVVGDEILGIEDNDATLETGVTVLNATLECRSDFDMPMHLIVVFFQYQELAWCLDSSKIDKFNECPVVAYDIFSKQVSNKISDNFALFFREYLELRAE